MFRVVIEGQVIYHGQHLNLIYLKFVTLYDLIPNSPQMSNTSIAQESGPHISSLVGATTGTTVN